MELIIFIAGAMLGCAVGVSMMCICIPSCGQKLRNRTLKPTDWVEDAIKMRQYGMILSDIALRVNRSTSTVWKQLKMNGVDK